MTKVIVVTFTEKATSELREKILNELKEDLLHLDKNNTHYIKLKNYYENFQDLFITTIHGFSNKLLKEFSFENKTAFENKLINDSSLYDNLLHIQFKKKWFDIYGKNLNKFLEISDFTDDPEKFESLVFSIIKNYKHNFRNRLIPEPIFDLKILIEKLNELELKIQELDEFLKSDETDINDHFLIKEYSELKKIINIRSIDSRLNKIITPLIKIMNRKDDDLSIILKFKKFLNTVQLWEKNINFGILIDVNFKSKNEDYSFEKKNPSIIYLINLLNQIKNQFDHLNKLFLSNTIQQLAIDLENYKTENSLISYDDMLVLLNDSLNSEQFLEVIQNKYKYALFDEFQDTDKIQWEIFQKIFLNNEKNKLLIIGDPKQSIYGFRNSDLFSYLDAKDDMINKYNAKEYHLARNFRSTKKLIDDFNKIFPDWFTNKIEYYDVIPAELKDKKKSIIFNETKRDATGISIFDLESTEGTPYYAHAEMIVDEIVYLLDNKDSLKFNKEINFSEKDICILVRNSSDGDFISDRLADKNIRSSFYKKKGLYQSDEALNLKYLLKSICFPNNKSFLKQCLLTDFFNIEISLLNDHLEQNDKIKLLFEKWINLADKKMWPQFFQSILYDNGFLYRIVYENNIKEIKNINFERKIINYRHLFEKLELVATYNNFDKFKLNNYLNNIITNSIDKEIDDDLYRIDQDENKIKIVTIHSSKGLEFPVVFLFSKFSYPPVNNYYKFHTNNEIILDLEKKEINKIISEEESIEEEKRLYYVAFTRAIYKLYIPIIKIRQKTYKELSDIINNSIIKNFNSDIYIKFEKRSKPKKSITEVVFNEKIIAKQTDFFPVIKFKDVKKRKNSLFSFSKLHSGIYVHIDNENIKTSFSNDIKEPDEINIQTETDDIILPSSNYIGTMFHKILEEINFEDLANYKTYNDILSDNKIFDLINDNSNIYLFERIKNISSEEKNSYILKIAEIIHNTLTTDIGNNFKLCFLKNISKLHEIEFHMSVKPGFFLNGYIDCVFEQNGKYYLLDWKSNYLKNGYYGELFESEVAKSYELQYKIYLLAFVEWLKKSIINFNYSDNFGGIYYLYLRGIGIDKKNHESGIFYYKPDEKKLESIKNEIFNLINERIENE